MDNDFDHMDFRIIMESCMDLASAIEQKNRQDISYDLYKSFLLSKLLVFRSVFFKRNKLILL